MDLLLKQEENNEQVQIAETVKTLRSLRPHMVENQVIFIIICDKIFFPLNYSCIAIVARWVHVIFSNCYIHSSDVPQFT